MKKIKSIFDIFVIFLVVIIASFATLYLYSTSSLEKSLLQASEIQMEYSKTLLEQKIEEIELEADGILNSEEFRELHLTLMGQNDDYRYVTDNNQEKENLRRRQKSNVGMAQFILYWPKSGRIVTTTMRDAITDAILESVRDNQWFIYENEVYFTRRYVTDWDDTDDEPYLAIQMDRDYLYRIKTMASGMDWGGTVLLASQNKSLFSVSGIEEELIRSMGEGTGGESAEELSVSQGKYQIIRSGAVKNGLELVSYYPLKIMMRPVTNITWITGGGLIVLFLIGLVFMILYYRNILLQLRILTGKLKQVESGDFTAQITELPNNEFAYVFGQFNRMVTRIIQLIEATLKKQQLLNQAELRQLQLQINPHFLYNSLSYIVTVADQPKAVTRMAVHMSNYYRYCTRKKSTATIDEEVSYVKAYLAIMAMRKNIEYTIEVSEELGSGKIIPLIIQPIVENAVKERENAKQIDVKIYELGNGAVRFDVSDDGDGMTEAEIGTLMTRLSRKEREEDDSVGLWNVNQRLINYYDESAGLRFGKSIWGGLLVYFTVSPEGMKNESFNHR